MGLDQYLHAQKYVSEADWRGIESQRQFADIVKTMGLETVTREAKLLVPSAEVSIMVHQWRKANQIHKWFVDNVQYGEDDCRSYDVAREQLEELLALCVSVLSDRSLAEELLPVSEGFFFGSNEYADWYFEQIEETSKGLSLILTEIPSDYTFTYQSSW